MSDPPAQLDGAHVICWVASRSGGFYQAVGLDLSVMVAAMAESSYADSDRFYLFECDCGSEVIGDWDCESVAEAQALAADHANGETLSWQNTV